MFKEEITISVTSSRGGGVIVGDLAIPSGAKSVVVFAHGSGSSRRSARNQFVAEVLQRAGLATLLLDLLTLGEDLIDQKTREFRFDIKLLTSRLLLATDWIKSNRDTADLNIGYFGSSTGAAAALIAATQTQVPIYAIVSRGGRVDLAEGSLEKVQSATLFIVGGLDKQVLDLNRLAYESLPKETQKKLIVVPDATHLFEEEGKLEYVAELAKDWFVTTEV
jgi:pimeloyl-ACP methyl ester carboxylesterase